MARGNDDLLPVDHFRAGTLKGVAPSPRRLSGVLLAWFAQHAEDLPWRRTRDPYAIWVSEVMLQQTQVATVIPYYERWLAALPDLRALAAAPMDRVLKLWEGLGYYSRARHLRRAAQQIVEAHHGRFPRGAADIVALPGVGRYTAGAIRSIAFNEPCPILDGNVIRVLTRVFGIAEPARSATTQKGLWALAGRLVEGASKVTPSLRSRARDSEPAARGRAGSAIGRHLVRTCPHGALNQALMELGRRVCIPRNPLCSDCPLQRDCQAFRQGAVVRLPNLGDRPATVACRVIALVLERDGRCWVRQRPDHGVNGGLWEFPNQPLDRDAGPHAEPAVRWPLVDPRSLRPLITLRHSITRHRITLEVWRGRPRKGARLPPDQGRWVRRTHLDQLAFASAHRKIARFLQAEVPAPVERTRES